MNTKIFQEDLKEMSLDEALKKNNLSLKELFNCHQNRKFTNRPINTRNISELNNGVYTIQKNINGVKEHYGTYHNLEDAKKIIMELEKYDWDKKKLPFILDKLNIDDTRLRGEYKIYKEEYLKKSER